MREGNWVWCGEAASDVPAVPLQQAQRFEHVAMGEPSSGEGDVCVVP